MGVSIRNLDRWIDLCAREFASGSIESVIELLTYSNFLAVEYSDVGRSRILERANDAGDPSRDFILSLIAPRMRITTNDLSADSAAKLVDLFLVGKVPDFHSPGAILTERFITEELLPSADMKGDKAYRRRFEQLLRDAGRSHDRRYAPPWLNTGTG